MKTRVEILKNGMKIHSVVVFYKNELKTQKEEII